ncbi:MAG: glycoside hydrolase family 2 TIM barrel-domain containing protein [Rikenellaceae bacterium]
MKITPYIILLFAAFGAHAQEYGAQARPSTNTQLSRSAITPYSSLEEAAPNYEGATRYAIEVGEWEQMSAEGGAVEFRSSFISPFAWVGRQAFVSIESASAPYEVYVGGTLVGEAMNPSMPAEFKISGLLPSEEQTSIVIIMQRDAQVSQLEAWGSDAMELGRVVMLTQPTMYIRDVEVKTTRSAAGQLNASVAIAVKSEALNERTSRINYELLTPQGRVVTRGYTDLTLDMRREDTLYMFAVIPDSLAWSAESPSLYRLNLSTQYRGHHLEYISLDLGLRSIEVAADGELLINGESQALKGVEIPVSSTVEQMEAAKAAGLNIVKIAAGAHSEALCDYADQHGLYVIATAPINTSHSGDDILRGGNPTNDPDRLAEYIERIDAIYHSTKQHASVVAYSLADSSLNGINLYEGYLYLKQREDQRPIIYFDNGGEWNGDLLQVEF